MLTIRNSYHRTERQVKARIGDTLSVRQVKRIRRALCPNPRCECGGALSEFGWQPGCNGVRLSDGRVRLDPC